MLTELLIMWIETKGLSALSQINGDFAGAIFRNGEWILFRDHMGVRPLYYYLSSDCLAFSSDLVELALFSETDLTIDSNQLYLRMINGNYLSMEDTDFEHVKCVKPGYYYKIKSRGTVFEKKEISYWQLKKIPLSKMKEEEYITAFRQLIKDAVKRRAEAFQEPLGGELSGGLDSGVIDILLSRLGKDIQFGSWSLPEEELPLVKDDERKIIYDICQQEEKKCFFTSKDDQPFMNQENLLLPPFVNTVNISITAGKMSELGVQTVFSGHGGDETVSHRCNEIELWNNREYFQCIPILYGKTKGQKLRVLRTIQRARVLKQRSLEANNRRYGNIEKLGQFLNPDFLEVKKQECKEKPFLFGVDPVRHILQGAERSRLDNLAYQSSLYGVRYVVPFLDYRLVEYSVSLPRHLFFKHGMDRYIFRKAFEEIMPDSLKAVDYKDTPSLRGIHETGNAKDQFVKEIKDSIEVLDKETWSRWLALDVIEEKYSSSSNLSDEDCSLGMHLLAILQRCGRIQKIYDRRGKDNNQ